MDDDVFTLNSGQTYPGIGFGTWRLTPNEVAAVATETAIKAGYRLFDTAQMYGNEAGVAEGMRRSGVPREQLFLTSKLHNDSQGYDAALAAFAESLRVTGLDYLDLFLIHWPEADLWPESWQAMQEIAKTGQAKAIGVSNFNVEDLRVLLHMGGTVPAINQIEFHPFVYQRQKPVIDFCLAHSIAVEAYSPLARVTNLDNPVIQDIARSYSRTPAQIMLRWSIQHQTIPLPRSANPERIAENFDIFGFELSGPDMDRLDSVEQTGSVL